MAGQECLQVLAHADRSNARSASAVRNAEGLVQVQMAHVRSEMARAANTDKRVEVRAVHVNLAAIFVDDLGRSL